jgi:hypothetical protein
MEVIMTVFNPNECSTKPRADMFLPGWLNGFGIFLDIVAVALLVATFITQTWALAIGFVIAGLLGVAATLCWKNQTIRIIDEDTFEYSTFLGKKIRYRFAEIKELRVNQDSMTLFVGNGKVHIEAMVVISQELMDKIDTALANRPRFANE